MSVSNSQYPKNVSLRFTWLHNLNKRWCFFIFCIVTALTRLKDKRCRWLTAHPCFYILFPSMMYRMIHTVFHPKMVLFREAAEMCGNFFLFPRRFAHCACMCHKDCRNERERIVNVFFGEGSSGAVSRDCVWATVFLWDDCQKDKGMKEGTWMKITSNGEHMLVKPAASWWTERVSVCVCDQ